MGVALVVPAVNDHGMLLILAQTHVIGILRAAKHRCGVLKITIERIPSMLEYGL